MFLAIDAELKRPENGGPGDGTETIIKPKEKASDSIQVVPIVSAETVLLQKDFVDEEQPKPAELEAVAEQNLIDTESNPRLLLLSNYPKVAPMVDSNKGKKRLSKNGIDLKGAPLPSIALELFDVPEDVINSALVEAKEKEVALGEVLIEKKFLPVLK